MVVLQDELSNPDKNLGERRGDIRRGSEKEGNVPSERVEYTCTKLQ
jgi:hypothetical protein